VANFENLNISGMGTMSGGEYNDVSISGMGTVSGDLKAVSVQVSGNGVFKGDFASKGLSVSGRVVFDKDVSAENGEISGSLECKGDLTIGKAVVSGRIAVGGDLKTNYIEVFGYLSLKGGLEAENFTCKGSFIIEDLLNSESIDISIGGFCSVKEIGCEKILVRIGKMSNTFSQIIQFFYTSISGKSIKNNKLVAQSIEGNDVNLEHTEAEIVRGKTVRIGQRCVIEKVEYSDTISIDPDAKVKEIVKL